MIKIIKALHYSKMITYKKSKIYFKRQDKFSLENQMPHSNFLIFFIILIRIINNYKENITKNIQLSYKMLNKVLFRLSSN